MPIVFRYKGYRFFFYSNEGEPGEPLHIHVRKGEATAKIWLQPDARVAEAFDMSVYGRDPSRHVSLTLIPSCRPPPGGRGGGGAGGGAGGGGGGAR
ncbi:MAG: DUF4160 domain-containing protein, partial [bacterium]